MTYSRLFDSIAYTEDELQQFRLDNFISLEHEDRIRCQKCGGYHMRLWFDMGQCCHCKNYSMIEVGIEQPAYGEPSIVGDFTRRATFLQVPWIRAQIVDSNHIKFNKKIEHPVTHKKEFIVFQDRLKCRVTGDEVLIDPIISGYWAISNVQLVSKVLTGDAALKLVNELKGEGNG